MRVGTRVGDSAKDDGAVFDLKCRPDPTGATSTRLETRGTIGCGLETMEEAWEGLQHTFSVGGPSHTKATHIFPGRRSPHNLLRTHPVDILAVDQGGSQPQGPTKARAEDFWMDLVRQSSSGTQPTVTLESWPAAATSWSHGPTSKSRKTRWEELGHRSRFQLLRAVDCGGAIQESRLIVARVGKHWDPKWRWERFSPNPSPRPMGNLLTPWGLPPRHVKKGHGARPGTTHPHSDKDPMPNCIGAIIDAPKGPRRLQADEVARGLGCPSKILKVGPPLSAATLRHTTSVFIWEALAQPIRGVDLPPPLPVEVFETWDALSPLSGDGFANRAQSTHTEFEWAPPDLAEGSPWHQARVQNLRQACNRCGHRSDMLFQEGLEILRVHRGNCASTGASVKQLQLLWWEFPPEHWDSLREGSRVGFLTEPPGIIHPNSPMDEEQLRVAAQFVDELLEIGAIGLPPPGVTPTTNTPLFCVPKPGQPGEWRVTADCEAGGQNSHIGSDPVCLNRPLHILEQMHSGGHTAVADASKFFHQFPVHPDDQQCLGIVHPVTGVMCAWKGCPMGSGSSPGLAGRCGLAFVRLPRERSHWFAARAGPNCWWTSLRDEGCNPDRGHGFSLERADGSPAVEIWIFVDDFAIHGPDLASTAAALQDFLDLTVDVGLLVHPKKLKPPSQVQQCTGFIFDTRGDPVLRVPTDKVERATAMAECLRRCPAGKPFSRLALSVIAGTPESLADATPNGLGHTHLRNTHRLIHPERHNPGQGVCHSSCPIPDPVRAEMDWWLLIPADDRGRKLRSSKSSTLIPTWGDGSGTGTGGTVRLPDEPLHLWMGQWAPMVHHHSSNWKELKTLLLTLQQLSTKCQASVDGTTVFHFTDNTATHCVTSGGSSSSPGPHALVEKIQLLSLELGIHLEAVHVPGVVMIEQGTDGPSRGMWMSSLHPDRDQKELTRAVFDPLPTDVDPALSCVAHHRPPGTPALHHWSQHRGNQLFHHSSIWFPPPELARQCLIGALETWVEQPWTTSALLFTPRTLSRCWTGLSKHLILLDTIFPTEQLLRCPPILPMPVLVLCPPPHQPSLPAPRRLDPLAKPPGFRWHEREATRMRELPPGDPSQLSPHWMPLPFHVLPPPTGVVVPVRNGTPPILSPGGSPLHQPATARCWVDLTAPQMVALLRV